MFDFDGLSSVGYAVLDRIRPPRPVHAHCDIPCGIYDPHEAQIAALTVLRMDQLIGELAKPGGQSKPEEIEAYHAKLSRYMAVKEQHAERVKSELRVIFGDYVTADHLKQSPDLPNMFIQVLKQASKARQGTTTGDAQELVHQVQSFAEWFWKSKGATPKKIPSMQKSGGEIVVPG